MQTHYRHTETHQWEAAITFLHSTTIQPAKYRSNLWTNISREVRALYFKPLDHLVQTLLAQHHQEQLHPHTAQAAATSTLPLWRLLMMFDMIILHPTQGPDRPSPNTAVRQRLQQYKQGHIQQLYQEAQQVPPASAHSVTSDAIAAQLAADQDNYSTAYQRLTNTQQVALLTPEAQQRCQELYPQPTSYQSQQPQTRHPTPPQPVTVDPDLMRRALQKIQNGTAAGPHGDFPATLKAFGLHQPDRENPDDLPYLKTVAQLLQLVLNAQLPEPA